MSSKHRTSRLASLTLAVLLIGQSACSQAPTVPATPLSGTLSLSGNVVGNQSGAPVSGAIITIGTEPLGTSGSTSSVQTAATGSFSFPALPAGSFFVSISAPGYVLREFTVELTQSRSDVDFDIIQDAAPFSLEFYRQFARGAEEFPGRPLLTLLPWTMAPSFYIRTVTEDTAQIVEPEMVDAIERIVINSVPELSGGRFQVAAIETGVEARAGRTGWVTISLDSNHASIGAAGTTAVAPNTATVRLQYQATQCDVCIPVCRSLTEWAIDHEIVHVMGFFHTTDGLTFHSGDGCVGSGRPAITRYHAAVMYSRAPGNRDPDQDTGVAHPLSQFLRIHQ